MVIATLLLLFSILQMDDTAKWLTARPQLLPIAQRRFDARGFRPAFGASTQSESRCGADRSECGGAAFSGGKAGVYAGRARPRVKGRFGMH